MQKLTQKLKGLKSSMKVIPLTLNTTEETVYRYRKQRGVNLGGYLRFSERHQEPKRHPYRGSTGSWFVLERWITDEPFRFAHEPGQSDLDVARGSRARETLEAHWDSWITEDDWAWLAQHGINSVRIPARFRTLTSILAFTL